MVHHGTILFDANLSKLSEVLIPNKLKIESKGIKSIRQRVTNILSELDFKMYHDEFIEKLISFFEKYQSKRQELPSKYDKELKELGEFKNQKNEFMEKSFFFLQNSSKNRWWDFENSC